MAAKFSQLIMVGMWHEEHMLLAWTSDLAAKSA
jgi:hypothetical protein